MFEEHARFMLECGREVSTDEGSHLILADGESWKGDETLN